MLGRTLATVLLLLASQLASGCCGCYRPFFCCKQRFYGGYGGCCEPCTTCYGGGATPAPVGPPVAISPPSYPVYNTYPVQPSVPTQTTPPASTPANNPPIDRIPSFGAAIPTSGGHR